MADPRLNENIVEEMQEMANALPQAVVGEPINVEHQALAAMLMIHEALVDLGIEIQRIGERL